MTYSDSSKACIVVDERGTADSYTGTTSTPNRNPLPASAGQRVCFLSPTEVSYYKKIELGRILTRHLQSHESWNLLFLHSDASFVKFISRCRIAPVWPSWPRGTSRLPLRLMISWRSSLISTGCTEGPQQCRRLALELLRMRGRRMIVRNDRYFRLRLPVEEPAFIACNDALKVFNTETHQVLYSLIFVWNSTPGVSFGCRPYDSLALAS
ncbi:uncharacterized protein CEXT_486061 [Caerostris extrusa]|uniref:Uncharacterized protein n=1 Tax=Caerostris extrusa TaxID=172846 RepID=A0AAV4N3N4_CAEEX|nr:uncharacterized protein CEXT_486061 [Caerostris extrusa]